MLTVVYVCLCVPVLIWFGGGLLKNENGPITAFDFKLYFLLEMHIPSVEHEIF